MDDKTRAKELAKAYRAALYELHGPLLEDAERPRIRDRMERLAMKITTHLAETGRVYDVPGYSGEPGRWKHSTRGFWGWRTEWIDDEEEN